MFARWSGGIPTLQGGVGAFVNDAIVLMGAAAAALVRNPEGVRGAAGAEAPCPVHS